MLLRSVFETILFQSRITRSRLSNFRNLSTVRDKVVDQPFLFNCLHKYISYRCAVGRRGEICNLCAKETSYVRFQKFLCSTNTRASKREIERERHKFEVLEKAATRYSQKKKMYLQMYLLARYTHTSNTTTREGIEAPIYAMYIHRSLLKG